MDYNRQTGALQQNLSGRDENKENLEYSSAPQPTKKRRYTQMADLRSVEKETKRQLDLYRIRLVKESLFRLQEEQLRIARQELQNIRAECGKF